MPLYDSLSRLGDVQRLPASQREELRQQLERLEKAAARENAQDHGGGSRSATIRRLVVDGDLDVPTGTVRIGPVATGKGNVLLSSGGIQLRTYTTTKIDLQRDGDIFIGENTAAPATTNIAFFTNAQTYNSESVGAGDMLIGDNSTSKANILWDKSAGQLLFRGGTTTTTSIDTDGLFNFANGRNLRWNNAAGVADKAEIGLNSSDNLSLYNLTAGADIRLAITLTDATTPSLVWDEDPSQANRTRITVSAGVNGAKLTLPDGSSLGDVVIQTAGGSGGSAFANFPGAVNVGTGSSTTAGELTVQNDIITASGKYIGLGSSAGRLVFTDAATDTLAVTSASLTVDTGLAVGTASLGGTGTINTSGAVTIAGALTVGTADSTNGVFTSNVINSATNAYLDSFVLNRYTSGTAANGLGGLIKTQVEDDNGVLRKAFQLGFTLSTAATASFKARAQFYVEDSSGTREFMRGEASGSAAMLGFYGSAATTKQTVTGSRGANAALASLLTALATLGLITDSSS